MNCAPLAMIENMVKKGNYDTYGIFFGEQLVAYACLWEEVESEILLFDYFAVVSTLRNQGYGTEAMKVVLDTCKEKSGIVLEVENPDRAESEKEREIRNRRVAFYERCGFAMSDVRILMFGVEYSMMYESLSGTDIQSEITAVMESLYGNTLPKPVYENMFQIL